MSQMSRTYTSSFCLFRYARPITDGRAHNGARRMWLSGGITKSGMLWLSSDRTLKDFKHLRTFKAGIGYDVITQHASTYATLTTP